ncbi:hypothetical protein OAM09_05545 [Candidatus Pelagibacter sp.]|nr:hypothetical protein [Candidatus Pelagibacter sp.]
MLDNKFGIILDEGPIARCLIETAKRQSFRFNEIIYLGKKNILPKNFYINFNIKFVNSKPLKFLKIKELKKFINEVENYFELGNNFFKDAYANINFKNETKSFHYIGNKNINSIELFNIINNSKSCFFFNTGKQIIKKLFQSEKKFFHIHPGILPEIKGADSSLWNIKKKNCFGGSLFIMNEKIDEGDIIYKTDIKLKKFNIPYEKFSDELYDIWFSFIDPAIRSYVFKKSIEYKRFDKISTSSNNGGEYFSFMDINLREEILKDILTKI